MKKKIFLLTLLFISSIAHADFLDKKVVEVGKAVPDFELQDINGGSVKLSDLHGKFVMIHFWSAQCPFVIRYEQRIQDIAADYKDKNVEILGIDSNSTESLEQIQNVAKERNINYTLLIDPQNKIADQFGAITTPHIFIINPERTLIYEGAVDDQGYSEDNPVNRAYVREVLDSSLKGEEPPVTETKTVGCTVKRAK